MRQCPEMVVKMNPWSSSLGAPTLFRRALYQRTLYQLEYGISMHVSDTGCENQCMFKLRFWKRYGWCGATRNFVHYKITEGEACHIHRNQTISRKGAYIISRRPSHGHLPRRTVGAAPRLFCGFFLK
jgi:hypothetical protein